MKHEVSSQPNINSEILNQSIYKNYSDPHVLKFISILNNIRKEEAAEMVDQCVICG